MHVFRLLWGLLSQEREKLAWKSDAFPNTHKPWLQQDETLPGILLGLYVKKLQGQCALEATFSTFKRRYCTQTKCAHALPMETAPE